jgi:hypothetical protein
VVVSGGKGVRSGTGADADAGSGIGLGSDSGSGAACERSFEFVAGKVSDPGSSTAKVAVGD